MTATLARRSHLAKGQRKATRAMIHMASRNQVLRKSKKAKKRRANATALRMRARRAAPTKKTDGQRTMKV